MKVISKRIARNEFASRKNGVIPSLADEWIVSSVPYDCNSNSTAKKYVYSTYSSAVQKANELGMSSSMIEYKGNFVYQDHNYGLVVSDIIIPQSISTAITDYTDFYVNIPDENGGYYDLSNPILSTDPHYERDEYGNLTRKIISGGTEVKILTYTTLNKWYTFFKEYYEKIKPFNRAIDYYNNRYENKNDENEKKFTDLDSLFDSRGGEYMFDWLNGYCFPNDGIGYLLKSYSNTSRTFTAFTEYADYFSTNDLLILYNKTASKKYELKIDNFTKTSDNGGKIICSLVIKEGEEVEDIVLSTGDEIELYSDEFEYSTNSASYVIPILFTNSIDDLGEMAIFSSKWKDGVDYSDTLDKLDTDNVSDRATPYSGSTVIYQPYYKDNDGDVITIQEAYVLSGITNKGYEQNDYYENVFVENQWANYTDYMIDSGNSEFTSYSGSIFDTRDHFKEVTTYAFSPVNGNVIYNPQSGTCENDLTGYSESEIISYIDKRFVVINDELVDVINGYYVVPNYDSSCLADLALKTGKAIPVIKDGPLKYAELNGKKFYASTKNSKSYIYFLESLCCDDEGSEVKTANEGYIIYDNNLFLVNNNNVRIGDDDYEVWCGYFIYNGTTYFINCNSQVLIDNDTKRRLGWSTVTVNNDKTVTICHKLDVKQANRVTGYTESKLELLRRRKINTDELGHELPGFIDFDFSNELTGVSSNLSYDIIVGEDCDGNITAQFKSSDKLKGYGTMYNTAYDRCILDLLYVPGQFSDLEYQKTVTNNGEDVVLFNGNYLESIEFYHLNDWGEKIDIGETDTDSRPILKEYFNGGSKYDPNKPVYCDITYYIGATIEDNGNGYKFTEKRHKGVKYIDTFTVNKLIGNFFMSDNTTFPFFYYELKPNISAEYLDDFKDVKLINQSYFEMVIMTFGLSEGTRTSGDTFNEDYWVKNNGMITTPVFRNEYNLFSSTPQKEDDNIYIDRGISAAFESHLKLLETHTLESLENYSNGYFKINEY